MAIGLGLVSNTPDWVNVCGGERLGIHPIECKLAGLHGDISSSSYISCIYRKSSRIH